MSFSKWPTGDDIGFLAATKQLYKWYFPSVRLSVRLSVTPFWLCSHHRIIMKFSGVITNDQRKLHAEGQGQRSKVKVTEVTTQLNRFRTVTPVWIHIWWWNDAYSLMLLRRGALLFFEVICQISRSHAGLGSNTYLYLYLYLNTQISVFVFVFVFEKPQDEIFVFVFDWRIWVYLTNIFQIHFSFCTLIHNDNKSKYDILFIS